jgi:hypothetical protein
VLGSRLRRAIAFYRLKGLGLRRPGPGKDLSRGAQHDHEEKSSYAHDFLS